MATVESRERKGAEVGDKSGQTGENIGVICAHFINAKTFLKC